jgi:hypothetical protein
VIFGAFELGTSDVGIVVVEPGRIVPVGLGKSEAWIVADGLGKSEGKVTEGLGKSEGVPVGPETSVIFGAFELGTSDVGTVVVEPGRIVPVGLGKAEAWMVAGGLGKSEGKVAVGLGNSEGKVTEGLGKSEAEGVPVLADGLGKSDGRVTEGLGKSEGKVTEGLGKSEGRVTEGIGKSEGEGFPIELGRSVKL